MSIQSPSPRQFYFGICSLALFFPQLYLLITAASSVKKLRHSLLDHANDHMDIDTCSNCGEDISRHIQPNCPRCFHAIGPPNVREVSRPKEKKALTTRYETALETSQEDGSYANLSNLDAAMLKTCAVINVDLDFLHAFLTNEKVQYSTYMLLVRSAVRIPAEQQDDRRRTSIESMFFGSYAEHIRYAALSLDGSGVTSYGPFAMQLSDVAIAERATLLEENSFDFIDTYAMRPGDAVPPGYRSTWQDRHKIAVAKLAERVSEKTTQDDHAALLLYSDGNHEDDDFIEVHIYGPFNPGAIAAAKGRSSTKNAVEGAKLKIIKDILAKAGKTWIER